MNNRPVGRREDGKMDNRAGPGRGKGGKRKRQENGRPKESAGFPLSVRAAYRDRRVAQRVARVYVSAYVCPCVFLAYVRVTRRTADNAR